MKSLILIIAFLAINILLTAQNDLHIERIGHNEILISNKNSHSISVEIKGQKKRVIPGGFGYRTNFTLSTYNVNNTAINVGYDNDAYQIDVLFCNDAAYRRQQQAERNKDAFYVLSQYLSGNISAGRMILVLFANGFIQGVSGDQKRLIEAQLTSIFSSPISYNEKEKQAHDVLQKFLDDKKDEIAGDQKYCEERAQSLLREFKPRDYYASRFIDVLEKSHYELSPFVMAGFRVLQFKEELTSNPLRAPFNTRPPIGFRLVYNYSSYDKNHKRRNGVRRYIPFHYMRSPAVFKQPGTSNFPADTALSWQFLSAGYGLEYQHQYTKRGESLASIQVDFGLVTSIFNTHVYKNGSLESARQKSSFNGVSPYFNLGYKERVLNWLEIYLSYYNSSYLFNLTNKSKNKDTPGFRQFNLGININFGRRYSYQY